MTPRLSMRPRFDLPEGTEPERFFAALKEILSDPDIPYVGQVLSRHAYLQPPPGMRTLLSPYLNLQVVTVDGSERVRGRFTPHPAVWTGFMAIYGVLAMVGLSGLVYGLAQVTVSESPWAMLAAPVCLALGAFVYGAALIGQGLTQDEMYGLRVCVERLARGEDPLLRGTGKSLL